MFTGIVEELGTVALAESHRLEVSCRTVLTDSGVGSSIAVNGACLTVAERAEETLAFDLSDETLRRTALGRLRAADPVNLERPVTLTTRLGGHLVQGHVDAVGRVARIVESDNGADVSFRARSDLMRYVVQKGSVAVDGVSLTVAAVEGETFCVALIPHTLAATTLGRARPGDPVNLEMDVMAKYVEGILRGPDARSDG